MIGHILPIESLTELKIHQNQYFIPLFQSNCQILNLTLVQDGCVSLYPPIMKLQILTNFDKVLKTLVTHFTQSNHMIVVILHKHQYLTTFFQSNSQILDSGSRALWTCVILLEQPKILIDHVLPIQLFDWAQKSSKPILYPTISIQWSNFKSKSGTRWTLSLYPPSWNSNIDQFRQSFENCDYSYFTIQPSNCCHTSQTPISHHILPIQWLDSGFEV